MCGIAGYWGSSPPGDPAVERTLDLMRRRGPDDRRACRADAGNGRQVCLLHARLRIIDLDARANQPFTIGSTTIVYNGEIYNYVELREQLEAEGVAFRTTSDTEVLLQCYRRYGEDCVRYFEGMWSFAIWDADRRVLFLSRDRFAEKPMYLRQTPHGLYFGSEPKFLAALAETRFSPNIRHLRRYLAHGYKSLYKADDTFFEGVTELRYAENLTVGPDRVGTPRKYWSPAPAVDPSMTLEDAIDGTRARLLESVRIRLRSDVPLAFCLSGGVDSAALVSIAAKAHGCRLETFSIIDDDERYNEEENILATVRDVGCAHRLVHIPKQEALPRLVDLVSYHDAPIATPTYYVHSLLSQAMHDSGYRVAFSGTSADELFTGYYDHFLLHLNAVRGDAEYPSYLDAWQRHTATFVRNPLLKNPNLYAERPTFRDHIYDGRAEIAAYFVEPFDEPFTEHPFTSDLLRNRMLNELFHEATPVILHEDDLNSMRYSIENRSPYLDTRLMDFAYSIPAQHLIRDGYAKAVLRDAVKGILNDRVRLDRRKKGFNASINSLVDLRSPEVRSYLLDPTARIFELIRRDRIAALFDVCPAPNHVSKFLFAFMNARIFLEQAA